MTPRVQRPAYFIKNQILPPFINIGPSMANGGQDTKCSPVSTNCFDAQNNNNQPVVCVFGARLTKSYYQCSFLWGLCKSYSQQPANSKILWEKWASHSIPSLHVASKEACTQKWIENIHRIPDTDPIISKEPQGWKYIDSVFGYFPLIPTDSPPPPFWTNAQNCQ